MGKSYANDSDLVSSDGCTQEEDIKGQGPKPKGERMAVRAPKQEYLPVLSRFKASAPRMWQLWMV